MDGIECSLSPKFEAYSIQSGAATTNVAPFKNRDFDFYFSPAGLMRLAESDAKPAAPREVSGLTVLLDEFQVATQCSL